MTRDENLKTEEEMLTGDTETAKGKAGAQKDLQICIEALISTSR